MYDGLKLTDSVRTKIQSAHETGEMVLIHVDHVNIYCYQISTVMEMKTVTFIKMKSIKTVTFI